MGDHDAKVLIAPSTKESDKICLHFTSNERYHQIYYDENSWYKKYVFPYAIITISVVQVTIHGTLTYKAVKLLRFEPNRDYEIWRFITYMFIHNSWCHIILNVVIQCLFAITLEKFQGSLRVSILYFTGGTAGALGAACVRPDLVVGASAGVYALLLSHISHIFLNYEKTKYKLLRCLAVGALVISDVSYNIAHVKLDGHPTISWGAHVGGAVTGLFLGLIIYKSRELTVENKTLVRSFCWTGIVVYFTLILLALTLRYEIKKCTPEQLLQYRYIYFC